MAPRLRKIPKNLIDAKNIHRYVIDHDMGFSPNPFHGYCTLANCKPVIRRCAAIGDFVMGFGSAKSLVRRRLIYWMRVDEIISYDEYWIDGRFASKKPIINGSHIIYHGDNIYHTNKNGQIVQAPSFHSLPNGETNKLNLDTDTGNTHNVLISKTYGYYGRCAVALPDELTELIAIGRGHRTCLAPETQFKAIRWMLDELSRGFLGEPSGWASIKNGRN